MSIFASLLQCNHSLADTKKRPYNTWQDQDAWNEDSISDETHIDPENDGPAWINSAKDRTQSITANLETSGTYSTTSAFKRRLTTFSQTNPPNYPSSTTRNHQIPLRLGILPCSRSNPPSQTHPSHQSHHHRGLRNTLPRLLLLPTTPSA